jgi:hypothetical protein
MIEIGSCNLSQNYDRTLYVVVAADVAKVYIACLYRIFRGALNIWDWRKECIYLQRVRYSLYTQSNKIKGFVA